MKTISIFTSIISAFPFVFILDGCGSPTINKSRTNGKIASAPPQQPTPTPIPLCSKDGGTLSTDINPPTWTWKPCDGDSAVYRLSFDGAASFDSPKTSFTPDSEIRVGKHTLRVTEGDGHGKWLSSGTFVMNLTPKKKLGTPQTDPNPGDTSGVTVEYGYPLFDGVQISADALEVSGPGGFSANDAVQGYLGDCWLVSELAAIASANPHYFDHVVSAATDGFGEPLVDTEGYPLYNISLMIPKNGEMVPWHYLTDAKFPVLYGTLAYARVTADGDRYKIGIPLIEKGLAQLADETDVKEFIPILTASYPDYQWDLHDDGATGYKTLDAERAAAVPVQAGYLWMVGTPPEMTTFDQVAIKLEEMTPGDSVAASTGIPQMSPNTMKLPSGATLVAKQDADIPGLVVLTYTSSDGSNVITMPAYHGYTILKYESEDKMIQFRNPWGETPGMSGVFTMPANDAARIFDYLFIEKI